MQTVSATVKHGTSCGFRESKLVRLNLQDLGSISSSLHKANLLLHFTGLFILVKARQCKNSSYHHACTEKAGTGRRERHGRKKQSGKTIIGVVGERHRERTHEVEAWLVGNGCAHACKHVPTCSPILLQWLCPWPVGMPALPFQHELALEAKLLETNILPILPSRKEWLLHSHKVQQGLMDCCKVKQTLMFLPKLSTLEEVCN